MSVVTPFQFMHEAFDTHHPVCAFNIDSFEMAQGVIRAIEQTGIPSYIQVTTKTLDIWGWAIFSDLLTRLANEVAVPTALHLDHAVRYEDIERALDLGFTSVMFDGSALSYRANVEGTVKVKELARQYSAFVEAEIGHVGRDGEPQVVDVISTVEEAVTFVSDTAIHALAIAVGTRHGYAKQADDLRFDRVRDIHEAVQVPLVLHGASRLSTSVLQQFIREGITKINMGTELRRIWWESLNQVPGVKPRRALEATSMALKEHVEKTLVTLNENLRK